MFSHRQMAAGLMAGACLVLTACAPTGVQLKTQTEASSMVCAPSDEQGRLAIAQVHVQADGSDPTLIRAVTLQHSDNVRIEGFGVIEDGKDGFRGVLLPSDAQISDNHEVPAGENATIQLTVALIDPLKSGVIESVNLEYDSPRWTGSETVSAGLSAQVFPVGDKTPKGSMCDKSEG